MMASSRLTVGVVAELRELLVEILDSGFLLLQQIGDQGLLSVLDRLLVGKKFLDIVAAALFWDGGPSFYGSLAGARISAGCSFRLSCLSFRFHHL
jgi:hypothetical protein